MITLDLSNHSISGKINPALFNLTSLQHLNLAYNLFDDMPLPQTGFEQLANLTHLNLSNSGFAGQVPVGISSLKNLISLDLSSNIILQSKPLYLHEPGLRPLLINLTKLQVLRLDRVNISSGGSEWGRAISQVGPTLQELSMQDCSLAGPIDSSLIELSQIKVVQLDLNNINSAVPKFFANFSSLSVLSLDSCELWGHFPEDIFHLTNLTVLYLSGNLLLSGQLPEFKEASSLQHLDLSNTKFSGRIPNSIGNLQHLSRLDLSSSDFYGDVPASIANLSKLAYLDFSENGFTGDICPFFNLHSILELNLASNYFTGSIPSQNFISLTSLRIIDLRNNSLSGRIPMSMFSHPSLQELYLSTNKFSGILSEFSNGSLILKLIDLGANNLQGKLPIFIFKLPQLTMLILASNNFVGTLDLDIIKHSMYLEYLDLSNNKLSVTLGGSHNKSFYASFPNIRTLKLVSCNLTKFPSFLSYGIDLFELDLSNNKIDGAVPNWLWNNEGIVLLNLSHNLLTGIEGDKPFLSLEYLMFLDVHSNIITGPVPFLPPLVIVVDLSFNYFFVLPSDFGFNLTYLTYLSLSNNSLKGEIPLSICNATNLQVLDLSYNNLTGRVPHCLLEGANSLAVLNLKDNKLCGSLPQDISQGCEFRTINLSGNRINGSLPRSMVNCNALEVLDLGKNLIVDVFPYWLQNLENLKILVLRSNKFFGSISNRKTNQFSGGSFFPMLKILDISSNSFSGPLPKEFFKDLKAMKASPSTSTQTVSYEYLKSTGFYQNSVTVTFRGLDVELENSLDIFSSLDLSNNGFWGEIPEEIGQLKFLDTLNLSHNGLIGPIPSMFANLEQLESLDLSFNKLSGHIPQELTALTFLSVLNLSYNNLVGEVPQANQFLTFLNNSYLGNPKLCGTPLSVKCVIGRPDREFKVSPSKSSIDLTGLSISIGLGFSVGFASVIWTLVLWHNGRKWFNFNVDRFYFGHLHHWKL